MGSLVAAAQLLAHDLLAPTLPSRWAHVKAVGDRARRFQPVHDPAMAEILVAAAYVHDIGYSPRVASTGFHPLDGARYLRGRRYPEEVACLVAHHTCSRMEAELRELDADLDAEFPRNDALPHDELLFCDLTTGPTGQSLSVDERLTDIRRRYGPGDPVRVFIERAEGELRAAAHRAQAKLARPTGVARPSAPTKVLVGAGTS